MNTESVVKFETIFEKKIATYHVIVHYDRVNQVSFYKAIGTASADLLIESQRAIMGFTEKNNVRFTLVDTLETKGSFSSANKFMTEEAFPTYEKNGLKALAMCVNQDVFTRFAMNQLMGLLRVKFDIKVVGSMKDAVKFLESKGALLNIPPGFSN